MSAPEVLFHYLGSPEVEGAAPLAESVPCWLCAGVAKAGMPVRKWIGPAFTSHSRARFPLSKTICAGCIFLCGRLSPVPGRPPKEGKSSGGNWRNYSHWMAQDESGAWTYGNGSKGDKPQILAALEAPKPGPWWFAVADSGQKHVIPWAPINPGGDAGWLAFEGDGAGAGALLQVDDGDAYVVVGFVH